jgi:hypothetical protein
MDFKKRFMRSLLFILAITCSGLSFAQGNLQFNQVISISTSIQCTGANCNVSSINYTVPTGKVWKLESSYALNTTTSGQTTLSYRLNGLSVRNLFGGASSHPDWYKAGDVISLYLTHTDGASTIGSANYRFSIIEFNIVP